MTRLPSHLESDADSGWLCLLHAALDALFPTDARLMDIIDRFERLS